MFLHVLCTEALPAFVLDDFLKDVCICIALEDKSLPPKKSACMLATLYRRFQFPKAWSSTAPIGPLCTVIWKVTLEALVQEVLILWIK